MQQFFVYNTLPCMYPWLRIAYALLCICFALLCFAPTVCPWELFTYHTYLCTCTVSVQYVIIELGESFGRQNLFLGCGGEGGGGSWGPRSEKKSRCLVLVIGRTSLKKKKRVLERWERRGWSLTQNMGKGKRPLFERFGVIYMYVCMYDEGTLNSNCTE